MHMLKSNLIILIITFIILQISYVIAEEKFLSLKKDKVNVRYGPSFDSPVKYIYKKINLPIMQIDEKENFRRIIDYKKIVDGYIYLNLKKLIQQLLLKIKFCLKSLQFFQNQLLTSKKVDY